jgi:hypothetical protein
VADLFLDCSGTNFDSTLTRNKALFNTLHHTAHCP